MKISIDNQFKLSLVKRGSFFLLFLLIVSNLSAQVTKIPSTFTFKFLEGPAWNGKNAVYFSDQDAGKIYKYVPETGFSQVWSGELTNGIVYNTNGTLTVCQMGTANRIVEMDTLGVIQKVLADKYNGKGFNRTNDLCKDKKGGIYFTDPTWGFPIQDKQAVYYIKPSGEVIRISGDFQKPNGICLSPDGTQLFVNDYGDKYIYVFDVQEDGSAINKQQFATLNISGWGFSASSDGMKIDSEGTLYVATSSGIQVINKDGVYQKTIAIPETPTNMAFGGKDLKTLYITAGKNLYSTTVEISGNPITSAKNLLSKTQLIYPNPTSGKLHIGIPQYGLVKVYSVSGKLMMTKSASPLSNSIDIGTLPKGIYFLRIESGKSVYTGKVILQHE